MILIYFKIVIMPKRLNFHRQIREKTLFLNDTEKQGNYILPSYLHQQFVLNF